MCSVTDSRVENVTLDFDDQARCGDDREGSDLVHDLGSATNPAKANRWHSFVMQFSMSVSYSEWDNDTDAPESTLSIAVRVLES